MCVITLWDESFEKAPVIIGYYFGEYDRDTTDRYIYRYVAEQAALRKAAYYLEGKQLCDADVMEESEAKDIMETIESVKQMIINF